MYYHNKTVTFSRIQILYALQLSIVRMRSGLLNVKSCSGGCCGLFRENKSLVYNSFLFICIDMLSNMNFLAMRIRTEHTAHAFWSVKRKILLWWM